MRIDSLSLLYIDRLKGAQFRERIEGKLLTFLLRDQKGKNMVSSDTVTL